MITVFSNDIMVYEKHSIFDVLELKLKFNSYCGQGYD